MSVRKGSCLIRQLPYIIEPVPGDLESYSPPSPEIQVPSVKSIPNIKLRLNHKIYFHWQPLYYRQAPWTLQWKLHPPATPAQGKWLINIIFRGFFSLLLSNQSTNWSTKWQTSNPLLSLHIIDLLGQPKAYIGLTKKTLLPDPFCEITCF